MILNPSVKTTRRKFLGASLAALALLTTRSTGRAASITSDVDASTLPVSKRTPLGLYLSPRGAHRALKANPEILFVDVRDPIEIMFVGHAEGLDRIIPLRVATHEVDPRTNQYKMKSNPSVVANFDALLAETGKSRSDPVFVSCRSGSRSAAAVRILAEAGYTNVWNLTEGFEGDRASDGTRSMNGWRNSGLPWGYRIAKGVAWVPG